MNTKSRKSQICEESLLQGNIQNSAFGQEIKEIAQELEP
jgi:hypothetical protein